MDSTGLANLADPGTYAEGVPHETFRRLRSERPLYFQEGKGAIRSFWAVTRYEDVVTVSKDPGRFSSYRGSAQLEDYDQDGLDMVRMMMLNMDPPQHGKFRRLVSSGFTPLVTSFLEPRIRAVTTKILDAIAHKGEVDFVPTVAAELPLYVIAELLGVPEDDRHKLFEWSNRLVGFDDPELGTSMESAKEAGMELWMYANTLAEHRRSGRVDSHDFISILMNAEVDGTQLTEAEFDAFILMLTVAGNETTRNLLSGGLLALMQHPDQMARLLADPSLIPGGIEEMLRWVSPITCFRRTATRDTELAGQAIHENDKVVIYYASANRDERAFPDPARFDVGRTPNDHLAFGVGEHFCLGANLARLEIRILFTELLRRFPDIQLAGPVSRLRSSFINGIKHLPVRFTPERAGSSA